MRGGPGDRDGMALFTALSVLGLVHGGKGMVYDVWCCGLQSNVVPY